MQITHHFHLLIKNEGGLRLKAHLFLTEYSKKHYRLSKPLNLNFQTQGKGY